MLFWLSGRCYCGSVVFDPPSMKSRLDLSRNAVVACQPHPAQQHQDSIHTGMPPCQESVLRYGLLLQRPNLNLAYRQGKCLAHRIEWLVFDLIRHVRAFRRLVRSHFDKLGSMTDEVRSPGIGTFRLGQRTIRLHDYCASLHVCVRSLTMFGAAMCAQECRFVQARSSSSPASL